MPTTSKILQLMNEELPPKSHQRRKLYRTSHEEVTELFKIINEEIFDNVLSMPELQIRARCRNYWGYCFANDHEPIKGPTSNCIIRLSDKWYCKQWLISILAHEACHQYQWDIIGEKRREAGKELIMSHGPSFFIFRDKLANHGIPLKISYSSGKWFKHQQLSRC